MLRHCFFLVFLLPAYICGSQPDAARILIDSPWAVPTDATMDDPADKAEIEQVAPPAGVGQPGANNGRATSSAAGGAPRWDGGITKIAVDTLPPFRCWCAGIARRWSGMRSPSGTIPMHPDWTRPRRLILSSPSPGYCPLSSNRQSRQLYKRNRAPMIRSRRARRPRQPKRCSNGS